MLLLRLRCVLIAGGYIAVDQADQFKSLTLRAITYDDLFHRIISTVTTYLALDKNGQGLRSYLRVVLSLRLARETALGGEQVYSETSGQGMLRLALSRIYLVRIAKPTGLASGVLQSAISLVVSLDS